MTDHIEPSKGREDVFARDGNFLALCMPCHNVVTAKFDRKYHPGNSLDPKLKWMNSERERNQVIQERQFPRPKFMRYVP